MGRRRPDLVVHMRTGTGLSRRQGVQAQAVLTSCQINIPAKTLGGSDQDKFLAHKHSIALKAGPFLIIPTVMTLEDYNTATGPFAAVSMIPITNNLA